MKHKNGLGRRPWLDAVTYIALILASLISMFPVLWAITTALKTDGEVNSFPPTLLPSKLNLGNFSAVIFQSDFPKYLLNSVIVTVICILVATLIAAHAAYALTNFRIRYKKQMMFIILMTSMVPPVAMLVPLYMLAQGERRPLREIVPGVAASLAVWMLLSLAFSYYVEHLARYTQLYGAIAAIVVVLLWLYMSGTIMIMGAEFNGAILEWKNRDGPSGDREEQT